MRRSLFNLSQSRRVLLGLPFLAGLCQFPLSSPLRESISQAWIDKLSGTPTGVRTRIATLKGWPPRPLRGWEHIAGFYLNLLGRCAFNRHNRPRGISSTLLGGPGSFDQPVSVLDSNQQLVLLRRRALPINQRRMTKFLWESTTALNPWRYLRDSNPSSPA